jgi:hypothetical protein
MLSLFLYHQPLAPGAAKVGLFDPSDEFGGPPMIALVAKGWFMCTFTYL